MSAPIKPATDEEIATIGAWNCDCRFNAGADRHTKDCFLMFGPRLVARIESDAAQISRMAQALVKARKFICDYDAMNQSHLWWQSDTLAMISKVLKEATRG